MNFGEDGKMIDVEDEEEEPGPSKAIVFDENVFKEEDLDNLSDSEDESEPDIAKLKI
jgi:hypothetical protein